MAGSKNNNYKEIRKSKKSSDMILSLDEDSASLFSLVEGRVRENLIKKVKELIKEQPEKALIIIRRWLYQ